jgi:ATP-binding cassette subfamily F protein uup
MFAAAPAERPRGPRSGKRRMSYQEQQALKTLPGRIAALQASIRTLQASLDDPGLYARDRHAFADASEKLGLAQSELAEAEEKWLELEILREEIEGG